MTEKIRKPIGKRKKLPQFTIMNVIEGQAGLENYSSLFFYSLTIDNILNIIVLLILAGIALNLTIGQNGIFQRAQDAANTWRNAETNEQLALQEGADLIDQYLNGNGGSQGGNTGVGGEYNTATTVADAIYQNKFFEKDTTIKDDLQNDVKVPQGFKIASDSATKVEGGIVIEDKDGNQFVWIPAKTGEGVTVHTEAKGDVTIVYKRTAYSSNEATGETDSRTNSEKIKHSSSSIYYYYIEALPTDEETSVNANGGYYIGRFEAGDKEATEAETMRTGTTEARTITIKKDQVPYNYISQANCKTLAEGMSDAQGYKAKTKLVSSYAWDTAISLIQITNEDYGNSSVEGNYKNTSFTYKDISTVTDEEKTKSNGSRTLVPTGQTTAVCNIYDMGGNLWEYTTERFSNTSSPCPCRGGCYLSTYANSPAGSRDNGVGGAGSSNGFRLTLYVQ